MRDRLVFYVNGTRHEVRGEAAGLTLSDYLRHGKGACESRLTGTKVACAEGDCGACTVLVGRPGSGDSRFVYHTVDACIAFVHQFDRSHIVTVEGLGGEEGVSPVQQAMIDCHGSQCGFCTPGFVMALQGLAEESHGSLTNAALRLGLSGNLCRCTGYAQILEAGKKCADTSAGIVASLYDTEEMTRDFQSLDDAVCVNPAPPSDRNGDTQPLPVEVILPGTINEMLEALSSRPQAKLVSGATDLGVQFNHGRISPTSVIATNSIDELKAMEIVDGRWVIGAGVTWSQIEAYAEQRLPEYHQILTRFGSPQVRHLGTLAGNLANASPIADSIPFYYVAESVIELRSVRGERRVPIESFYLGYKQLDLAADEAILRVHTPLPGEATKLKLYKISKRRDMDISTVTLAFWIDIERGHVTGARIAAGGVGPTVVRLRLAEKALTGQPFALEMMRDAGRIAREEVTPISDVRGSEAYRSQLVENLFAKCWHELSPESQVA